MTVRKPFKFAQMVHDFREEPLTYVVIAVIVAVFAAAMWKLPQGKTWSDWEEIVGTAIALFGTLWTSLGIILSHKHTQEFRRMKDAKTNHYYVRQINNVHYVEGLDRDISHIASALLAASTFGTAGVVLIILGSMLLIARLIGWPT